MNFHSIGHTQAKVFAILPKFRNNEFIRNIDEGPDEAKLSN